MEVGGIIREIKRDWGGVLLSKSSICPKSYLLKADK